MVYIPFVRVRVELAGGGQWDCRAHVIVSSRVLGWVEMGSEAASVTD